MDRMLSNVVPYLCDDSVRVLLRVNKQCKELAIDVLSNVRETSLNLKSIKYLTPKEVVALGYERKRVEYVLDKHDIIQLLLYSQDIRYWTHHQIHAFVVKFAPSVLSELEELGLSSDILGWYDYYCPGSYVARHHEKLCEFIKWMSDNGCIQVQHLNPDQFPTIFPPGTETWAYHWLIDTAYDVIKDTGRRMEYVRDVIANTCCEYGRLDVGMYVCNKFFGQNYIDYASIRSKWFDLFSKACYGGHLHIAKWCLYVRRHRPKRPFGYYYDESPRRVFVQTCHNGHFDIAKWLLEETDIIDVDTVKQLLRSSPLLPELCVSGRYKVLKWLMSDPVLHEGVIETWSYYSYSSVTHLLKDVVSCGNLALTIWFCKSSPFIRKEKLFYETILLRACRLGYVHMLNWLCSETGFDPRNTSLTTRIKVLKETCTRTSNLRILKWWHGQVQLPCTKVYESQVLLFACARGKLRAAKWLMDTFDNLHGHSTKSVGKTFKEVCEAGHLEMAQWIYATFPSKIVPRYIKKSLKSKLTPPQTITWLKETFNPIF